jgi:hypothetical protein
MPGVGFSSGLMQAQIGAAMLGAGFDTVNQTPEIKRQSLSDDERSDHPGVLVRHASLGENALRPLPEISISANQARRIC